MARFRRRSSGNSYQVSRGRPAGRPLARTTSLKVIAKKIETNKLIGAQRLGKLACGVCSSSVMGSSLYVTVIGLIGTAVTAFNVMRIVNRKPEPDYPADPTRPSRVRAAGPLPAAAPPRRRGIFNRAADSVAVPEEVERDLKLMTSILSIEHYTLIMLGALTDYPMLHAPWLLMQLCVIAVELLVFLVRLFLEGLHVSRDEVLLSMLNLHNWMQVFCLFERQAAGRLG
ncbi:uncharacterized protein LOC131667254 [Phymastichus coffea]|uniref:uncharacterized protein LOC131667254 n=1 Tax=Phymastichus coffea TaxID=108790 RepID=UPI00273B5050|nr:uncharacterized protein LOC131667254 [Phymastichus coffea]